jgi:polyisoprenoid-binding protein YceI
VTAEIDLASINTGNEQRDAHLRSTDFFETDAHPTMTYRSTGVRRDGEDLIVDGELTLKGVTREVPLRLEIGGFGPDAYGGTRAGFSATAEINRREFGVNWNAALETGGAVVGDKVTIQLEIEAVLAS